MWHAGAQRRFHQFSLLAFVEICAGSTLLVVGLVIARAVNILQ